MFAQNVINLRFKINISMRTFSSLLSCFLEKDEIKLKNLPNFGTNNIVQQKED